MNYELAKRLKEAGFPQEQRDGTFLRRPWDSSAKGRDDPYAPTLEELIESCPKTVGKATFVLGSANQGQEWVACYFDFATNRGSEFNESGSIPVEAVACLWLALERKTTP
jgi:hypothetical protein